MLISSVSVQLVCICDRAELESLRKALEAENDVAMNAMKNKMIEIQKKHVAIIDEIKRKHLQEREELLKHGKSALGRGVTPTPNTVRVVKMWREYIEC